MGTKRKVAGGASLSRILCNCSKTTFQIGERHGRGHFGSECLKGKTAYLNAGFKECEM